MRAEKELPATPDASRQARDLVVSVLFQACCTPDTIELARLLVSELVTNSVVHTDSAALVVVVEVVEPTFRVTVHDDSPEAPHASEADPDDEHGRGLHLIEVLADRWAAEATHDPDGKDIWFEMACA